MIRFGKWFLALGIAVGLHSHLLADTPDGLWSSSGSKGAVASGSREATDAGLAMLQSGGNAADAAAATILTLSVTDSGNFCFGGEVPIIVYDQQRHSTEVLSGQGCAPRLATREHFAAKGAMTTNVETAAVPAALDAVLTLLDRAGTRSFAQASGAMLRVLDRHEKDWHANLAATVRRLIDAEKVAGGDRRRGLRMVADYFYRGPLAREIDGWSRENGGLLRFTDLATHVTRAEDPVTIDYRGYTICKCGPWTQGPFLLQTLRLLEPTDVKSLGHDSPDYIHLVTEAMKLALADRDTYYADPLFADVPVAQLLSKDYADVRRPLIDPKRASLVLRPGDPRGRKAERAPLAVPMANKAAANDTTTCLAADQWGNVVAATPSGWGGAMAGKTGVQLGTRLISLNTWADHPNCIEPGKRPRITLTPTLVLKDQKPALAISVAGGDLQDQVSIQLLLNCVDFGMTPEQAVVAPRFCTNHHIGSFRQTPAALGSLSVYEQVGEKTIADLAARGHLVKGTKGPIASPCVLSRDEATGKWQAAGDPKAGRHAAAY
ncbi:MAG TPA: gamma-glutamyltransferase [Pirellulaceae bacterium]|nr:gamma-glutamyltransferase [Pirellulaceae bacterium]